MIYVMSDIHGNSKRFDSVMEQINLQPEDTLYILGDVVDRYPDGIRILRRIMKMPNVKMLLGNHEYMMLEAVDKGYVLPMTRNCHSISRRQSKEIHLWYRNGGEVTHNYLKHIRKEWRAEVFEYLRSLPLNIDIEVDGKKYKLIHGSMEEDYRPMADHYNSKTEFAVWERWMPGWYVPEGYTLVFGHTPTCHFQKGEPIRIWHSDDAIGIDCGCGYFDGRLACLRLDDGMEFYSEDDLKRG